MQSDDAGARRFLKQKGITFPSLTGDSEAVTASFKVQATPHTVVIGRNGKVYYSAVGFAGEEAIEQIRSVLESLLAAPPAGPKPVASLE